MHVNGIQKLLSLHEISILLHWASESVTWLLFCKCKLTHNLIEVLLIIPSFCLILTGIQNDLWARFVTLPNQDRIWTLTVTNKAAQKSSQQGNALLRPQCHCLVVRRTSYSTWQITSPLRNTILSSSFLLQSQRLLWWWFMVLEEGWACGSGTWSRSVGPDPFTPSTSWALAGAPGLLSLQTLPKQRSSLWTPWSSGDSLWAWRTWFCWDTVWGVT